MRISPQDLRALYRNGVSEKVPPTRRSCPPPRRIIDFLDHSLSRRHSARVEDHLASCGLCSQEFEAIRQILHARDLCLQDLAAWAGRQQRKTANSRVEDIGEKYSPISKRKASKTRQAWRWSYALGLILLVGCLALVLSRYPFLKNFWGGEYRAGQALHITLVLPRPEKPLIAQALVFQWTPLIQAECYVLELFDEALAPIWKSPETRATRITLPSEILENLLPSRPYYWLVAGLLPDDRKVESDIGVFFIAEERPNGNRSKSGNRR